MFKLVCIFLLIIILVIRAWKIFIWLWVNPRKKERILRQQGFKGNPYSLRSLLFGETRLNFMVDTETLNKPISLDDDIIPRAIPFIHQTVKKYGAKCFMWAGTRPTVLVLDPDQVRTVTNEYNSFIKNFKVSNSIVQQLVGGMINFEGEAWSKSRGTLNPLFYIDRLKRMVPEMNRSCEDLMNKWTDLVDKSKGSDCVIPVVHDLETYTSKSLSRAFFIIDHDEDKRIYELLKEITYLTYRSSHILDFPGAKYLPTKFNREYKRIITELRKLFAQRIKEKSKDIKEGKVKEDEFFYLVLVSEVAQAHGIKTMDDILGQLQLFYLGGYETSAMMLTWIMILLGIHQDWQQRAREEVFQVFGDRKPDYEGLNQLRVVSMVINEVMRLFPPIVELSRLVEQDTKLGDDIIPADTLLMLPLLMVHRNPEYWGEDASEFKPDRFSKGVLNASNGKTAFFPFGWGPRTCIGLNFALLEGKIMLANLLRKFSLELSPTYTHAPYVPFTMQPQYDAPIILRKLIK